MPEAASAVRVPAARMTPVDQLPTVPQPDAQVARVTPPFEYVLRSTVKVRRFCESMASGVPYEGEFQPPPKSEARLVFVQLAGWVQLLAHVA